MVDYGPFEMEMYDGTVYKYPAGAQWAGRSIFNLLFLINPCKKKCFFCDLTTLFFDSSETGFNECREVVKPRRRSSTTSHLCAGSS